MATAAITPDQDTITAEIFIAAPPERVFQAITGPAQMQRWWGRPGCTSSRNGRPICAPAASGRALAPEPIPSPSASRANTSKWIRLAGWYKPGWPAGPARPTPSWELEPQSVHGLHPRGPRKAGTGTLVKIRHEGFAAVPQALAGHTEGWKRVMGWLVAYLERGETVDSRE